LKHPIREIRDGWDPLQESSRNFILIAHRARTSPDFPLDDPCGAGGRWDAVARCVNSALFLSHNLRRDTSIHIILLGPPEPPKTLTVNGGRVKYLNPDERSTVALLGKALSIGSEVLGNYRWVTPGIYIKKGGLDTVLNSIQGRLFLLDEKGKDIRSMEGSIKDKSERSYFLLSDDMNPSDRETETILSHMMGMISLGPKIIHSHHAITLVHNTLDRMEQVMK